MIFLAISVTKMLDYYTQENKAAAKEKAKSVISRLREMKLNKAADKLENGLEETLISVRALAAYTYQ